MLATSSRFWSVCEEDFQKRLVDLYLKNLDYSLLSIVVDEGFAVIYYCDTIEISTS